MGVLFKEWIIAGVVAVLREVTAVPDDNLKTT